MLNLGIIGREESKINSLKTFFGKENYSISNIEKKEQLQSLNGVVIFMKNKDELMNIVNWLLHCQKYPNVFVWIFSTTPLGREKEILLSLGVNGVATLEDNLNNLLLMIRNTFSRISNLTAEKTKEQYSNILNEENRTVIINGMELELTTKEYKVMYVLNKNINTTIQYQELIDTLWTDYSKHKQGRLANIIFHLREKIKLSNTFEIKTTRSKGYMLKTKN